MKRIYLAGGCFWGVEHFFRQLNGVLNTDVGYANSDLLNPSYEDVCQKRSDASETVLIDYDEEKISLEELLSLYFQIVDPTSLNKQGGDIGRQYRTGIYYEDDQDEVIISKMLQQLQNQYTEKIVIEMMPLINFYKAEDYHQDYLIKNPSGYCHLGKEHFKLAQDYKKR